MEKTPGNGTKEGGWHDGAEAAGTGSKRLCGGHRGAAGIVCWAGPLGGGRPPASGGAAAASRGLLVFGLFWGGGVPLYNRTVHPQVRRLPLNVDLLMLFWIIVRTLRFQLNTPPGMDRMLGYLYYAPMLGIPVLCVQLVLTVDGSERYRLSAWARMLWRPRRCFAGAGADQRPAPAGVPAASSPGTKTTSTAGFSVWWWGGSRSASCWPLGSSPTRAGTPDPPAAAPACHSDGALLGVYAVLYGFHIPRSGSFWGI